MSTKNLTSVGNALAEEREARCRARPAAQELQLAVGQWRERKREKNKGNLVQEIPKSTFKGPERVIMD